MAVEPQHQAEHNWEVIKKLKLDAEEHLLNALAEEETDDEYAQLMYDLELTKRIRLGKGSGLQRLLSGEKQLVATASRGEFTVGLVEPGEPMFLFKKGWPEPVPSGLWMGWPEEEWSISEEEWEQMSLSRKAELEAREQADRWVHLEYYQEWLDTYAPSVLDKLGIDEPAYVYEAEARKVRAVHGPTFVLVRDNLSEDRITEYMHPRKLRW